ncbi:hypothetical protein ACHHYP_14235 [Achlya hypogyna]|uniref:Uncharacterized protein n=1 Tax=Achlya hypogyna TaxID=1202772 RepID=A0A1V9YDN4_ACHHY|nr:hypothetical protein ACHHYP_14235 [Achlya hypogyna]
MRPTNVSKALVAFLAQSRVPVAVRFNTVDVVVATLDAAGEARVDLCLEIPPTVARTSVVDGLTASFIWSGITASLGTLHRRFQLLDQATPFQLLAAPVLHGEDVVGGPSGPPYAQWYLVVAGAHRGFWDRMAVKHAVAQVLAIPTTSVTVATAITPPYDVYSQVATVIPVVLTSVDKSTFATTAAGLAVTLGTVLAQRDMALLAHTPDVNGDGTLPQRCHPTKPRKLTALACRAAWPTYPMLGSWSTEPFSYLLKCSGVSNLSLATVEDVVDAILAAINQTVPDSNVAFAALSLDQLPKNSTDAIDASAANTIDFFVAGNATTDVFTPVLTLFNATLTPFVPTTSSIVWYPYVQLECPFALSPVAAAVQRISFAAYFRLPVASVQIVNASATATTFEIALNDTLQQRALLTTLSARTQYASAMQLYGAVPTACSVGAQALAYPSTYPGSTYPWGASSTPLAATATCTATPATGVCSFCS